METKTFESAVLIRFGDCDPFNHLNNTRYLEYFMNAREDHLLSGHNLNLVHLAMNKGIGWVVTKHQLAYVRPAMVAEVVVIQSTITNWSNWGIHLEMSMWDASKTNLKALLWAEFAHVDLKAKKRIEHSDEVTNLFKPYENPFAVSFPDFDSRLKAIREKSAHEL